MFSQDPALYYACLADKLAVMLDNYLHHAGSLFTTRHAEKDAYVNTPASVFVRLTKAEVDDAMNVLRNPKYKFGQKPLQVN